jgi:hypothetical protein
LVATAWQASRDQVFLFIQSNRQPFRRLSFWLIIPSVRKRLQMIPLGLLCKKIHQRKIPNEIRWFAWLAQTVYALALPLLKRTCQ